MSRRSPVVMLLTHLVLLLFSRRFGTACITLIAPLYLHEPCKDSALPPLPHAPADGRLGLSVYHPRSFLRWLLLFEGRNSKSQPSQQGRAEDNLALSTYARPGRDSILFGLVGAHFSAQQPIEHACVVVDSIPHVDALVLLDRSDG
ncbi:uncharacterized protein [Physcomitrium patens]|uniref:uncharacterized protein n=1 Tax=Physcomitrium patens TaxID=3218 RepID=UPI000D159F47|nr:uncharacterized protein LOC112278331 [Physcomitrium patens]|eukprot:XP_024367417.1 uncharacterized protein LOC112278331 [Physcomitrella patens]